MGKNGKEAPAVRDKSACLAYLRLPKRTLLGTQNGKVYHMTALSSPKMVITGAAGFLGGRAAKHFAAHFPEYTVLATSRRSSRADELTAAGCVFQAGDLTDAQFCEQLTQHAEIVVHCAALSAPFGAYETFRQSNIVATETLLKASLQNGAKRFIFISTPSIYFDYTDRLGIKESDPLPPKMVNYYAETKLKAEELVLAMNGQGIETIALRPRAIIGAEDTVIFPRVLEAYHKGRLKIIGDGENICDLTCVRNVIEAIHCCIRAAADACGEAYNITDGQPVKFWEALKYALVKLDLQPPTRKIPKGVALWAGRLLENIAKTFHPHKEPTLTRYGVGILFVNLTLNISKAQKRLRYQPVMTTFEGIDEYVAWHKTQA